MNSIGVTDATFKSIINSAQIPVVVYIWAPWCGPCKMVGPALERVVAKQEGRVQILKANLEECENIVKEHNIKASPTLLIFQQGQELARRSGAIMEGQISQWLGQHLRF